MTTNRLPPHSEIILRRNSRLSDFFARETFGKKIAVVGVATRGCKIAYDISLQIKQLETFFYVTCDTSDVAAIPAGKKFVFDISRDYERNPYKVRGLVAPQLKSLREALRGAQVTFVISGLGGSVGSAVAPLVAKLTREVHSMVVSIVSMPYNFEKSKYFFAGCALRQLKEYSDGIMLIDNDAVYSERLSIIDAYACINEEISLALNMMLGTVENGKSRGVETFVDFVRANPFTVLSLLPDRLASHPVDESSMGMVDKSSSVLVSYRSLESVSPVINEYDPVDPALRFASIDSDTETLIFKVITPGTMLLQDLES